MWIPNEFKITSNTFASWRGKQIQAKIASHDFGRTRWRLINVLCTYIKVKIYMFIRKTHSFNNDNASISIFSIKKQFNNNMYLVNHIVLGSLQTKITSHSIYIQQFNSPVRFSSNKFVHQLICPANGFVNPQKHTNTRHLCADFIAILYMYMFIW